jgi:hypothetical protein
VQIAEWLRKNKRKKQTLRTAAARPFLVACADTRRSAFAVHTERTHGCRVRNIMRR